MNHFTKKAIVWITICLILLSSVALYIDYVRKHHNKEVFMPLEFLKSKYHISNILYSSKNVISMSLYGSNTRYTVGAIRNAILVKTNFPGWTLRFYLENPILNNSRHELVPNGVIYTLIRLESEMYYLNEEERMLAPMTWRFLILNDKTVERFIVRDSDSRLTKRDYSAVEAWMKSGKPFHCIRDHPSHAGFSVSGGLWGGINKDLFEILERSNWTSKMHSFSNAYFQDMNFLNQIVWPLVSSHAYCSDSVSCNRWPNAFPFPTERNGTEHVGQVYNDKDQGRQSDINSLLNWKGNPKCLPKKIKFIG